MHIKKTDTKLNARIRISRLLDKLRGRQVEWNLDSYSAAYEAVRNRSKELDLSQIDNASLDILASDLRLNAKTGTLSDDLKTTGFALAGEAITRTLGIRYFDVQIMAAIALSHGRVIEMQTGEGKTMTAVFPVFIEALSGKGAHVLTFNDYLAKRDAQWMGPVYAALGMTTSFIVDAMSIEDRRTAYEADITYLTARELGYDILKQSLAKDKSELFMRPLNFALVDEADSIMIDEARVPLVIAGDDGTPIEHGRKEINNLVAQLDRGVHYGPDENSRNAYLTDEGHARVEELLSCGDLFAARNRELVTKINQALHAWELLKPNVDYIIRSGKVEIIDENTGRVVKDRHWPDGLQLAVEAKEDLAIEGQGTILGSISVQHLLKMYPRLAGMTGTVFPSDNEFFELLGLKTTVVPPNKPCVRIDHQDLLFTNKKAKNNAVIEEVRETHQLGRPILIGTVSVEESLELASKLLEENIPCRVLSAANDEEEASIIAQAGAVGAVTVSTNMAGRGTDIKLGGADEKDRDEVVAAGGLYVIGTNRFESRRIDDQLRGRAGRQGDPGESRFFVSMEDDLMVKFKLKDWIPKRRMPKSTSLPVPVNDKLIHEKIALTQRIVEGQNLDIRRTLYNYTSFVEKERLKIQKERLAIVLGNPINRLEALCPGKYDSLSKQVPKDVLQTCERQIYLYWLDKLWADHLARIADIREGIHLMRLGSRDPLFEFHSIIAESFTQMDEDLNGGMKDSFEAATITANGMDLDKEGLRGPSSTWTYLISDNPFDWLVDISGIGNMGLGIGAGVLGGLFVFKALLEKLIPGSRPTE